MAGQGRPARREVLMSDIALKCDGVTVSYGALKAIDGVSHSF